MRGPGFDVVAPLTVLTATKHAISVVPEVAFRAFPVFVTPLTNRARPTVLGSAAATLPTLTVPAFFAEVRTPAVTQPLALAQP